LHEDIYLILLIAVLSYCEDRPEEKSIRYYRLKKRVDKVLEYNGKDPLYNSSFEWHLNRCEKEKFIQIIRYEDEGKTCIYPNRRKIIRELEIKKAENLAYGGKQIVGLTPREIEEKPIKVTDRVTYVKNPIVDKQLSPRGPKTIVKKISH
jgi:hypothetical protein